MKRLILLGFALTAGLVQANVTNGYRFVGYNIWGDFFNNPCPEREQPIAETLQALNPDVIGLQECCPNFWKSRLFERLGRDYAVVGREYVNRWGEPCTTPVLYRRDRFRLCECGYVGYCAELDPSKGAAWAVLEDLVSHRRIAVFSTHFWWRSGRTDDWVRLDNAKRLQTALAEVAARHQAALVGGGDVNSLPDSSAMKFLLSCGWRDAQTSAPDRDPRPTCRSDPKRGADGVWRGVLPETDPKAQTIDHVLYTPWTVRPRRFFLDSSERALGNSDHLPLVFDFELAELD